MKKARLTILMPVYNVEKYVKEAIESVLNQIFQDFVLLVLDDCSTDNTAKIVASFDDKRIKYFKHDTNLGLAENLNKGVEIADTEYISRMDGDDISISHCLQTQIDYLDSHPEIGVCSVGFKFFGTKNSTVIFPENHEDIKAEQLFGCSIILPMLRRNVFIDNNLKYRTESFPAEDYRMWTEVLKVAKVHNLQEIMFYYRMHPEQISTEKRARQILKSNEARMCMLEWLSPEFTEKEKKYFLEKFVPGEISEVKNIYELIEFSKTIIKHNEKYKNFDTNALKKRFKKHFVQIVYSFCLQNFFKNGFSPKSFLKFINSGAISHLPSKLSSKIFVKSMFFSKK